MPGWENPAETKTVMPAPITAKPSPAQLKLLAQLPEFFILTEDFAAAVCPPTVITDMDGREVYRFTTGNAASFKALRQRGNVVQMESRTRGLHIAVVYGKA